MLLVLLTAAAALSLAGGATFAHAVERPDGGGSAGAPVTVTGRWVWGERPVDVDIAGLAPGGRPDLPVIRLAWERESGGWIPTWALKLYFPSFTGERPADRDGSGPAYSTESVRLLTSTPRAGDVFEAVLSYHPGAQVASVAVYRIGADGGKARIAGGAYRAAPVLEPLVAYASAAGPGQGVLESLSLAAGFRPVGDSFVAGEKNESGAVVPLRLLSHGTELVVQIDSPLPLPGRYEATLIPNAQEGIRLEQVEAQLANQGVRSRFLLPLSGIAAGPARIAVAYVEGEHSAVVFEEGLQIGRLDAAFRIDAVDRQAGLVRGTLHFEAPVPGVYAEAAAEFVPVEDGRRSLSPVSQAAPFEEPVSSRRIVWAGTVEGAAVPVEIPLPDRAGAWSLRLSLETTPEVAVRLEGAETFLRNDAISFESAWVAVTDQLSQRIIVLDPEVKDWNSPEAVKWWWRPEARNGFGGFLGAWGLPSGVKLRKNDVFGGYYMVVTDSRGLAAIVPYPSGDERKWAQVVGGNPHSAELLPDGNIAVAASTGGWVRVYTSSQGPNSSKYVEFRLKGAHGVLWDPKYNLLWAVGDDHLVGLEVLGTPDAPVLNKVVEKPLPSRGGHDLSPVYGDEDRLWVTTASTVHQYDKARGVWVNDYFGSDLLLRRANVKGVGDLPTGQVVAVWPKAGSLYTWTTDTVHLFFPDEVRRLDGSAIYKARVWVADYL